MRRIIIIFFLFISSCNLTKNTSSNTALKKIPIKILKEKIENNNNRFSFLMLRSQATIVNNGTTNQFNISIRLKKQEQILISGSLLIPLFKGLLTKNDLVFYEKLNKSFYRGNYDYIKSKAQEVFFDPEVATKEIVDEVFEVVNDRNKLIRTLAIAKSAIRHNMAKDLPTMHIPTGLIWGENDKVTPPNVADEFHKLLPDSDLYWIKECGHAPMMEHPVEFANTCIKWLNNHQ